MSRKPLIMCIFMASCQADLTGPQDVYVYGQADPGNYGLSLRSLATLESVREVKGTTARILQDGRLDNEGGAPRISGGESVVVQVEEVDDGLLAIDYEGLVLLSFYDHLEEVSSFFRDRSVDVDALLPVRTYVSPDLGEATTLNSFADNAAYLPSDGSFLLFDAFLFKNGVPLAANEGVVAHEFSHAIFHLLLNGGPAKVSIASSLGQTPARYLRAVNEGFADFVGAVFTSDPNFVSVSIPSLSENRRLDSERIFTEAQQFSVLGETGAEVFTPYSLGSVVAATAWSMAASRSEEEVLASLFAAVAEVGGSLSDSFTLTSFLEAWVANAGDGALELCTLIEARYEPLEAVDGCP